MWLEGDRAREIFLAAFLVLLDGVRHDRQGGPPGLTLVRVAPLYSGHSGEVARDLTFVYSIIPLIVTRRIISFLSKLIEEFLK